MNSFIVLFQLSRWTIHIALLLIVFAIVPVNPINTKQDLFTAGDFRVRMGVNSSPIQHGRNQFRFSILNHEEQAVEAHVVVKAYHDANNLFANATISTMGDGLYEAVIDLPETGNWVLAIDIKNPILGHGDVLFSLQTGMKGLHILAATNDNVAYYTCAMHPSIKSVTAGSCPICSMDLIAIKKNRQQAEIVDLDYKKRQMIGVTTDVVKQRTFIKTILSSGKISYDQSRLREITLKYDAWIESLEINEAGIAIQQGDELFSIYSPELISAQKEYLATFQHGGGQYKSAAAERLKLWGVNKQQLRLLKHKGHNFTKLPVLSPVSGTVVSKHIIEGSAVKSGAPLLRIADLSTVWLEAAVYQTDLAWFQSVPLDQIHAAISIDEMPDLPMKSVIKHIDPVLDPLTHSARIRFEIDNPLGLLRPNMYATSSIQLDLGKLLLIPASAVIVAADKRIVFVDQGKGKLKPVAIKTGLQNDQYIEVKSGLSDGQTVVTSGQFLIAAESKLKSGLQQW
ncbi:MAG: efflux RND transporter periplasmic adaptor subunit [Methylococcales bacterium]